MGEGRGGRERGGGEGGETGGGVRMRKSEGEEGGIEELNERDRGNIVVQ